MKNILLLVHHDDGQDARLQAALDVTRAVDGHLTCLDVFVPPAVSADFYGGGSAAALIENDLKLDGAKNRKVIEDQLAHEDVNWSWQETRGNIATEITRASELADLIVLNSHFDGFSSPDPRRIAADVTIKSGRPVLAVPGVATGLNAAGKALVAWDGSGPAANALKAALPLLQLAGDVTLFEVGEPDREYPATDAAIWLSRHEVHAKVLGKENDSFIAEAILERAHHSHAAYVVMGAFGHSRASELLFGGVTRSMLAQCDVPLFLAH